MLRRADAWLPLYGDNLNGFDAVEYERSDDYGERLVQVRRATLAGALRQAALYARDSGAQPWYLGWDEATGRIAGTLYDLPGRSDRYLQVNAQGDMRMLYGFIDAEAIAEVKDTVRFCARCFNYAEGDLCEICASAKRDPSVICVVSEPRDIPPIERTAVFGGVYHVLGGALSPMEGIGPDELRIAELMKRLASEEVAEVVLATNPNIEGETTAAYLARLIKPLGIKVTRPASGLPVGGDLEFADEVTLGRAFEGRVSL